jgi:hypothetical protein
MNQTAVEDLFLREREIGNTAGDGGAFEAVESEVKDWRKWGVDRTKDLVVSVWLVGPTASAKVKKFTAGAVTCRLQTMKEGDESWTDLATKTGCGADTLDENGRIAVIPLAGLPLKQFVRLVVKTTTQWTVGDTATAPKITAGLDNDANYGIDAELVDSHDTNPAAR